MGRSADAYMGGKGSSMSALGLLIASSIGAALGVMFAPKPGAQTRGELAEKARRFAWKFKHNRSEVQERVKNIFGRLSEDLEREYLEVRGEVTARMYELAPGAQSQSAYRDIVESVVRSFARAKRWTKAQVDRFIAHLEDEYTDTSDLRDSE